MKGKPRKTTVAVCAFALAAMACSQIESLPHLKRADLRFKPAQSSKIFAADGSLITTLHGVENRTVVPLRSIPMDLQHSVIAIEDERFYEHDGVDIRAILRAAVANAVSGQILEGGSTITQQYVKNVIIAPGETADRTFERKIDEAVLARQMERRLTKNEILHRYLNTVYFGAGAYGVQAAALTYFGKPALRLNLRESALLAGLIRSPEEYDPFDHHKRARLRRNLVLQKMLQQGWITAPKARRTAKQPLRLHPMRTRERYPAPYFVDYVRRLIKFDPRFEMLGKTPQQRESQLFSGGLRIYTTVDLSMQRAAERAAREVLPYKSDPHTSLVAIDPRTGRVKAMVGGRNYFAPKKKDPFGKLNLAISGEPGLDFRRDGGRAAGTGRQAGSAFKPFALAAAIDHGVSLAKAYKAASCMDFPGANNGGPWHVCNYEGSAFGNKLSLLDATVNSVNVVYAQLIMDIGAEPVVELARRMGIRTPLDAVPAAVLGANSVNPLGMASAYGTLAARGKHHEPVAITKITRNGHVLYRDRSQSKQVLSEPVAYITTSALEQVMQRGTGVGAAIGRPAAGKTGTAQEYRDAWFVGYTPNLVAAVWVGYPQGEIEMKPSCYGSTRECRPTRTATSGGVTGGSWPASIWRLFMLRALSGVPAQDFTPPEGGIVTVLIDTRNGCLAGRFTPADSRSYGTFATGTQPTKSCREPGDAVKVPKVFGFPVDEAVRVLKSLGFAVSQRDKASTTYPPGRVIGVTPDAGTLQPAGATVTITVSSRGVSVPDVLGMERTTAIDAIEAAHLEARTIVARESDRKRAKHNAGRVWKQSPAAGTRLSRGDQVTIWVNPG